LPEEDRKELESQVQVFLAEKKFEGCGGLEINDEMKVRIAGLAGISCQKLRTMRNATCVI
jgi:Mlc titration factor MtfA (ptsG expression regulator)